MLSVGCGQFGSLEAAASGCGSRSGWGWGSGSGCGQTGAVQAGSSFATAAGWSQIGAGSDPWGDCSSAAGFISGAEGSLVSLGM